MLYGIIINFEEAAQKKVEEIKNKLKEEKRTYERPMESRDQHFSNRYIQVDAKRNENNLSSKESEPTGEVRITVFKIFILDLRSHHQIIAVFKLPEI
ncbi:unnamed protein product [Rhizophagus irregularis]|nr:unnamed protein product [Rhizophagus irregularis]